MSAITDETAAGAWLEVVRSKVAGIRFGSVQVTVHEGRVTQVESIEKTRIAPDKSGNGEAATGRGAKKP